jgi:hypothetical protein
MFFPVEEHGEMWVHKCLFLPHFSATCIGFFVFKRDDEELREKLIDVRFLSIAPFYIVFSIVLAGFSANSDPSPRLS